MNDRELEYMDEEERELIESIENAPDDAFISDENMKRKLERAAHMHVTRQEMETNIRIDQTDLEEIKRQADRAGMKLDTFIKTVIHQYATGQLTKAKKQSV